MLALTLPRSAAAAKAEVDRIEEEYKSRCDAMAGRVNTIICLILFCGATARGTTGLALLNGVKMKPDVTKFQTGCDVCGSLIWFTRTFFSRAQDQDKAALDVITDTKERFDALLDRFRRTDPHFRKLSKYSCYLDMMFIGYILIWAGMLVPSISSSLGEA
ncbi:hypothetical protein CVT26_006576 [Gymnopilus dilepis]|uniref:Uncharacterized protein n=1 Tax=Gymnopilus dilepis TaxID=231916 RepID=A0A409Y2X6_9AGAR|nr:hypothetical protein CVT26_006576 [Gymnopilus dilepis]